MSEVDETKLLADAKKLPWDERVGHKNWKVRQDAYVDMAGACRAIHDPKDAKLQGIRSASLAETGGTCFSQSENSLTQDVWLWSQAGKSSDGSEKHLLPVKYEKDDRRTKDLLLAGLQVSC